MINLTPELRKEALDIIARYDHGPLYTPPSQRGTILVPGLAGGANWSGAAIDPETGILYVGTYRLPFLVTVRKPRPGESSYDYIGEFRYLPGPRGLPLLKPPFGSIVAIDMNTGEHRWRIPVGRGEHFPTIQQLGIREQLGFPFRSWALVTKTVMVVVQMGYYGAPRLAQGPAAALTIFPTSTRICGCTTKSPARCLQRSRCRPMRPARRSLICRAASNTSCSPWAEVL